jgi:hypothetical protein
MTLKKGFVNVNAEKPIVPFATGGAFSGAVATGLLSGTDGLLQPTNAKHNKSKAEQLRMTIAKCSKELAKRGFLIGEFSGITICDATPSSNSCP